VRNVLLRTDVYKMGHMEQYAPGTSSVYSYLCARSSKNFNESVFFGLQYFLKEYLSKPITHREANEWLDFRQSILGQPNSKEIEDRIHDLAELGYWPVEIRAIPEGTIVPVKNALFTLRTTNPKFHWAGGFIESLLLKVWYPTTVATNVLQYRRVIDKMHDLTCKDSGALRDFMVHDFGYRSDTSEESAAISGAAHLIFFKGSDTVPALPFIEQYYSADPDGIYMMSVPASEHSVMCSYGKENEMQAYERLLDLYPKGIVSIVSDTYDIWQVCTKFLPALKDRIVSREGKVVIRPDSGNPPDIICGSDEMALREPNSPEAKGVLRLLDETFGHTVNEQGYKVLNEKIGLIYGDGMYLQRYQDTLNRMQKMGYAASNLVVGIGGILRQGTRDTLGFALKATHVEVNGEHRDILKTPVTDPGKNSHCGYMKVDYNEEGKITTTDRVSLDEANTGLLKQVFIDGKITKEYTFDEIRENAKKGI
jgi:nicotinamide phosphoribosyltransferase